MRLFKKRQRRERCEQLGSHLAEKIALVVLRKQRKWADQLNQWTKDVSGKTWLIALILFCVVFGSYLIHLLICSIS